VDFRLQIADFILQISYYRLKILRLEARIWNLEFGIWNLIRRPASSHKPTRAPGSYLRCVMFAPESRQNSGEN